MKKLVLLVLCLYSALVFAQDEVSLVVSADGATKTQAIDNALRSAIEQTYGTFVSANTQILNDELVKDEIATVSSGNIQKYSEIAAVTLANGNTSVTLNVTVSLAKLISYAQSKGSECEFAGATFGANLRLYEFYKKNEEIAIQNMIKQLDALRPAFDYELEVSDPVLNSDGKTATIKIRVIAKANETTKIFNDIMKKTFISLAMTEEKIKPMMDRGFNYEKYYLIINENKSDVYFYNKIPNELSIFVPSALLDFSISDNLGGKYVNDFYFKQTIHNNHGFGYVLSVYDGYRRYCPLNVYNCHFEQIRWGDPCIPGILITDTPEPFITPQLIFDTISIDIISKIRSINITPTRTSSTNVLKDYTEYHTVRFKSGWAESYYKSY